MVIMKAWITKIEYLLSLTHTKEEKKNEWKKYRKKQNYQKRNHCGLNAPVAKTFKIQPLFIHIYENDDDAAIYVKKVVIIIGTEDPIDIECIPKFFLNVIERILCRCFISSLHSVVNTLSLCAFFPLFLSSSNFRCYCIK